MLSKRYSIIVADRSTGAIRRFTLGVRPALVVLLSILAVPFGFTVHARWSAASQIERLQLLNTTLGVENARYHTATTDLSDRITALQLTIGDLTDRSMVDPRIRRAMVRIAEASGDSPSLQQAAALKSPSETFSLLRDVLNVLDARLAVLNNGIEQQRAVAAATPVTLPSVGRLTARYGYRADPFTGDRAFHPAVDISTGYGQPIYATADGTVDSAGHNGNFGNLLKIDHGFNLITRYGHLSKFAVSVGDVVSRGDLIGYAGATGRATGSHVHYEVWVNGRPMNPLQLTSTPRAQAAN